MQDAENIASRLRAVFRHVARRAEALSDKNSPTRSEQGVLAWIEDHGAMSPKALADATRVRPQTMQQTLDSLDRRRWIRRENHPTDRRQLLISLTPAGRKALLKGRNARQAWLQKEISRLNPRERRTLTDAVVLLEKFIQSETPTHP